MKNAIEGLGIDSLLMAQLVAELNGEGGSLFVEFDGRGRHENGR